MEKLHPCAWRSSLFPFCFTFMYSRLVMFIHILTSSCFFFMIVLCPRCFGSVAVLGRWIFSLGQDYAALSCLVSDNATIIILCGYEFSENYLSWWCFCTHVCQLNYLWICWCNWILILVTYLEYVIMWG